MRKRAYVIPLLVAVLMALAACGGGEATTPTATPPSTGTAPVGDGLCILASPMGVAAGDTWMLSGSITLNGARQNLATTITVLSITTAEWSVGGSATTVADSQVRLQHTTEASELDGTLVDSETQEFESPSIRVLSLSPVLTMNWECHRQAWLEGEPTNLLASSTTQHTVEERTFPSGMEVIIFASASDSVQVELDIDQSSASSFGYDKATGRLVLTTAISSGTIGGERFDTEINQQLVPGGTDGTGGGLAPWLQTLIAKLQGQPVANPPLSIAEYRYQGRTVYYLPPRCCDIFSDLYDVSGNLIAHPDGGITGGGDGRAPRFFEEAQLIQVVWEDRRLPPEDQKQVLAPIESLIVNIAESFPPQYFAVVVSGLPNGCVRFAGWAITSVPTPGDPAVRIEVLNWVPTDPEIACAQVYGIVDTTIPLGSDFTPGTVYSVEVNSFPATTFTAQ